MKNQTFLGIFLMIIGVLGMLVGLIQGHFADSPAILFGYLFPVVLGIIMIVIDRVGKKK